MVSQIELFSGILKLLDRLGVKDVNQRQINSVIEAANLIVGELNCPHKPSIAGSGLEAWLACDETGMSSLYMAHVLAPLAGLRRVSQPRSDFDKFPFPHDPADFGRCVGLLNAAPELRQHIPALANGHGPVWAALAGTWSELEALYAEELPAGKCPKLYERLKVIREKPE